MFSAITQCPGNSAYSVTQPTMHLYLFVVPETTFNARLKAFQASETEVRELLEGTNEKNIFPDKESLICLSQQVNGFVFTKRKQKEIELVARPVTSLHSCLGTSSQTSLSTVMVTSFGTFSHSSFSTVVHSSLVTGLETVMQVV